MKKYILMALLGLVTVMPASAQSYRNSRYYNRNTGRLDYSQRNHRGYSRVGDYGAVPFYVGFRVGPTFSSVISDNHEFDGGSTKTGLNVGMAAGFIVSPYVPLFLESGLYYTEKGGKGNRDFKYSLNYLEMPFVLKYIHNFDNSFSIQPFFGGYVAAGVSGKVKNYYERESYNAFGDGHDQFKRFDGGLRMGIGIQYDLLYADLTYDLGLSNVGHDVFDEAKNSALMLNIGINF
ncbi:MAG: PorT family protein [Prevotella sp.]|nr:PorT family protein [Prevotella sp.]